MVDRIKIGDLVYLSPASKRKMRVVAIERVMYYGRPATFVDGIDEEDPDPEYYEDGTPVVIRRPLRSVRIAN